MGMESRLALGTVQFGQRYGVANKKGKISEKEAEEILQYAQSIGIQCLDTAFAYGDSEIIIGKYLENYVRSFQVISKLPELRRYENGKVEELLRISLKRLNILKLDGYLIHRFEDFLKNETLWDDVVDLKRKGLIERAGFSLYLPSELEILLSKDVEFDLIQLPYSIFDRRFEKYFYKLKERKVTIHIRSVFLQGLVFLAPDDLHGNLRKARKQVEILQKLVRNNAVSTGAICLNYVLRNSYIDKVVIGIDSLDHLKENINNLTSFDKLNGFDGDFNDLIVQDEDILLPFRWDIKNDKQ